MQAVNQNIGLNLYIFKTFVFVLFFLNNFPLFVFFKSYLFFLENRKHLHEKSWGLGSDLISLQCSASMIHITDDVQQLCIFLRHNFFLMN